jgi:hypothetical protein
MYEAVVAVRAIGHRDVHVPDRCKANGTTACGACDDWVQSCVVLMLSTLKKLCLRLL